MLLVLDEESRQSLATTGVNDLIAPFGMKLTPGAPYLLDDLHLSLSAIGGDSRFALIIKPWPVLALHRAAL